MCAGTGQSGRCWRRSGYDEGVSPVTSLARATGLDSGGTLLAGGAEPGEPAIRYGRCMIGRAVLMTVKAVAGEGGLWVPGPHGSTAKFVGV